MPLHLPTDRQLQLLRPTAKQNVPIPFNTHKAIVLPNPKTGLAHSIFNLTGRGSTRRTLSISFCVRVRQG
jgi:hypothetical protein